MTFWYYKKGQEEYDKAGIGYPKTEFDVAYDRFLRKTASSPPEHTYSRIKNITMR